MASSLLQSRSQAYCHFFWTFVVLKWNLVKYQCILCETFLTCFGVNSEGWKVVPGPFMILVKFIIHNFKALSLVPDFQIIQNVSEKFYRCLYLLFEQLSHKLWFNIYSTMYPLLRTNTLGAADLNIQETIRNVKKMNISEKKTMTFLLNKKFLICATDNTLKYIIR